MREPTLAETRRSTVALLRAVADDDFDDELPETGHDIHFLERVAERVELDHADLALRLYRDRALVRALINEEKSGADRVAIAIADGESPPHAIVDRGGAFVTCLAAGMTVGDRAVVSFVRVQLHIERAEVLADRQARAQELWRNRAGVRQLLERCDDAGARLAREDFSQLAALAPILEAKYLEKAMDAFARVRHAAPHVLRLKRLPPSIEPKLRKFWNRFHAVGHYLLLATVRGKQSFALLERATVTPRLAEAGFEPFRHIYDAPLMLGRGYVELRVFAALARAGELAVPTVKRMMAEAPTPVRWLLGAYALLAIGRRHRKLRAELAHAVGPARLPAFLKNDPSGVGCTEVLQRMMEGLWCETDAGDEVEEAHMRRFAESVARGISGEESATVVGDALSFARLAAFDCNFLSLTQDVAGLSSAVALCAEVAPEELYFPAASTALGPPFTPDAAKEYAFFVPPPPEPVRAVEKPGRNAPCSCGSGKNYKLCCGMN